MNNKKVILITGASSGMGKASAKQLISEGHIVYGAARRIEKMKELTDLGGHALEMDITNEEHVQRVVDQVISSESRIDVLINNAGFGMYGAVEDTSIEDARYQFEVNIFGLARITQLVLPHMRTQQSGKIINISSMGGKIYTPLGAWYHASKHALEGWSDSLRLELKPFNIDVVVIQPGLIATEFGDVMINPMVQRSGDGPYSDLAKKMAEAGKESSQPGNASAPSVVSNTISKAIGTKSPKTRYAIGKFAKPMIFLRTYLGDRIFDKIVMSQVK